MRRARLRSVLVTGLAVAAVIGLAFLLDAVSAHAFAPDSDGATVVLEGQAMIHGHPLLHGWSLSLDSFWTIDALWYVVGVLMAGLSPVLVHAVPAAIAAAAIGLGVLMAIEERTGGAAVAAGGTVIALLAFPSQALAVFLLRGPLHVGTALWCLVAFWFLRRGRFGFAWAAAVVFLAAGLLGDLQMLALGVVPVALAGVTALGRTRDWRRGLPLVAAAVAGVALAEVVRRLARALGTFSIAAANPTAPFHQMTRNVKHGVHEGVLMLGFGTSYYGIGSEPKALSYVHVLPVLVMLAAVAGTVWAVAWGTATGRPTVVGTSSEAAWHLDDMLVFATFASPAAYAILAITPDSEYARYLTAAIIFGSILTGRVVGRVAQDFEWPTLARIGAVLALATVGCLGAGTIANIDRAAPVGAFSGLATWLEAHHLRVGIGAYWSASVTTVESGGAVEVRPVVSEDGKVLVEYERNSAQYWYTEPFHFLVYEPSAPWGSVDYRTAVDTFGRPRHSYVVDGYRVLVWRKVLKVPPPPASG